MTTKNGTVKSQPTLQPGWWVALTLAAGSAPLRCYVGEVQAVDERGVRITLVDWLLGMACGFDLFVPWRNIESALVGTDQHSLDHFGDEAGKWQTRMCPDNPEELHTESTELP
jgi:hypothetical protein